MISRARTTDTTLQQRSVLIHLSLCQKQQKQILDNICYLDIFRNNTNVGGHKQYCSLKWKSTESTVKCNAGSNRNHQHVLQPVMCLY